MAEGIPVQVERFIREQIDSLEQLEVLLLLERTAPTEWSAEAVARELRLAPASIATRLEHLLRVNLVAAVDASTGTYRFAPANPAMGDLVRALAECYAARHVSVIRLIFSKPSDSVRSFADAFRVRRRRDENG